jgi:uncharacterized protein YwqG
MGLFDFFSRKKKENQQNLSETELLEKVEVLPGIKIPKALALHWPELEKLKLPSVLIKAVPKNDLTLQQSKFGGYACLPADFEYPKDANGNFMYPLAQINFREVPLLENYPRSGYLQFYISGSDDAYGLDLNDPQSHKNFRVLYFEEHEVEKYMTDFSFLDDVMQNNQTPVSGSHALTFSKKVDYVGPGDVRFEETGFLSAIIEKYPAIEDDLGEAIYDTFSCDGHKIGGYACFTQTDPRSYSDQFRNYILLFQMDSDDKIMWGDVGIANFFIHPDDLAKKDFSKVMYNWDCG